MENKIVENRYGVQIGDIFYWHADPEDGGRCEFYQVVALRGTTQVRVRQTGSKIIAFDGDCEGVAPLPDAWVSDEIMVRKVYRGITEDSPDSEMPEEDLYGVSIKIYDNWLGYAYLDREEMYLAKQGKSCFAEMLRESNPELAKQLDLQNGSGVFAVDRPFESVEDDCRSLIRYPDGEEEKVILKELLHVDE